MRRFFLLGRRRGEGGEDAQARYHISGIIRSCRDVQPWKGGAQSIFKPCLLLLVLFFFLNAVNVHIAAATTGSRARAVV